MQNNRFMKSFFLLLMMTIWLPKGIFGQVKSHYSLQLKWKGVTECRMANDTLLYIDLESGRYGENLQMPTMIITDHIYDDAVNIKATLHDAKAAPLTDDELSIAQQYDYSTDFELEAIALRSRDEAIMRLTTVPFRKNGEQIEKLISGEIEVTITPNYQATKGSPTYATQSVLSTGDWYKIGLKSTGIYKLTYNDLSSLGMDVAHLDPRQLRIYHNGGGVLPEMDSVPRHDDLVELPIFVSGEADGHFDANDYVLFYGRGPVCWTYDSYNSAFERISNPYDDYAYAFVTTSLGNGKRIQNGSVPQSAQTETVTEFLDYQLYENDDYNLNHMGRTYFGDITSGNSSINLEFNFPNIVSSSDIIVHAKLAGRNFLVPAYYKILIDGILKASYKIDPTTSSSANYANEVGGWINAVPHNDKVSIELKHDSQGSNSTSEGYVDFITVNAWRNLIFSGNQMTFRNPDAIKNNKVYEYRLSGISPSVQVWDVSDPVNPTIVKGQTNGATFSFLTEGKKGNEFIAFNGQSFLSAMPLGRVGNQNLHGIRNIDYVILTYPDFASQAERLKAIHAQTDPDMSILVVTPQQVYNEFGCGAKDISAIRDFGRMLYLDSEPGHQLKYLLLLGDASFDYKNRNGIVDFVPAFESVASTNANGCIVTDDFFGCFDFNEGNMSSSIADIGIGRFPVTTLEQATHMVDKIENYVAKNANTMGPWRNTVTLITDDDINEFVQHAEQFASSFPEVGGENIVVDKIYLGAYPQISTPNGNMSPETNAAINARMEKGSLVVNYTGHGGEVQLSEERILQKKDVDSWHNGPMYPIMITGTCEFSRYDDHFRTSLGEYSFLNPYGGMIAMFTTSRTTVGSNNYTFNSGVYSNLFRINGGEHNCIGDVYRMAKSNGRIDEKRYVLFGDPALRITYPTWTVETVSMPDTIKALQPVEIKGVVKDLNGNVANQFNGIVNVVVYDKESEQTAYNENGGSMNFMLRNSIIFSGQAQVNQGEFAISFTVPRDISYSFGDGLVSYYATDYDIDANGSYKNFIIGGFYSDAILDDNPPEIRLFIDDTLFVNGGITNESPLLLAFIDDDSGINTTGAGIGHDITATLSGAKRQNYCLNDYFVSEINNPGKGVITYKMLDLPDGEYTLTLKVWDINNNSNTATINFVVANSDGMSIDNLSNMPNPVTDATSFTFGHNQIGKTLDVKIFIYDIMGRLVTVLSEQVAGTSARTTPIHWDGCNSHGQQLSNGIYVYRIVATNDLGETAAAVSKLILSK